MVQCHVSVMTFRWSPIPLLLLKSALCKDTGICVSGLKMRQRTDTHIHPSLPDGRVFRRAYIHLGPLGFIQFHESLCHKSIQVDPGCPMAT